MANKIKSRITEIEARLLGAPKQIPNSFHAFADCIVRYKTTVSSSVLYIVAKLIQLFCIAYYKMIAILEFSIFL